MKGRLASVIVACLLGIVVYRIGTRRWREYMENERRD